MSRQSNIKVETSAGYVTEVGIRIETIKLSFLALQLASDIIASCERYKNNDHTSPLKKNIRMAEHGYANALLAQVDLLISIMKMYKEKKLDIVRSDPHGYLIKAVMAFKEWKENRRKEEIKECGENFGSKCEFTLWDPMEGLYDFK